jgi:hypothetical protein
VLSARKNHTSNRSSPAREESAATAAPSRRRRPPRTASEAAGQRGLGAGGGLVCRWLQPGAERRQQTALTTGPRLKPRHLRRRRRRQRGGELPPAAGGPLRWLRGLSQRGQRPPHRRATDAGGQTAGRIAATPSDPAERRERPVTQVQAECRRRSPAGGGPRRRPGSPGTPLRAASAGWGGGAGVSGAGSRGGGPPLTAGMGCRRGGGVRRRQAPSDLGLGL